jgi:hypothetical protein
LTITKAALVVAPDPQTVTFGSAAPSYTFTVTGFMNGQNAGTAAGYVAPSCTSTYSTTSPAGTPVTITCSGGSATNYLFTTTATALVTVNKASVALTVTPDPKSVSYGSAAPSYTATVTGFLGSDNAGNAAGYVAPTCSATYSVTTAAGTTPITCSGGSATNYTFNVTATGTLTITPAPVVVTASSTTVAFGAPVPTITASYVGFMNGQSASVLTTPVSCTTAYTTSSANGSTPSTSCSGAVAANYSFTYVAGTVTVGAGSLVVTPNAQSVSYGSAAPVYTFTVTGFVGSDNAGNAAGYVAPTCSATYSVTTAAGTTPITCSGGSATNYTFNVTATGTLTITPAPVVVTASSTTVAFGAPVPTITASYVGFMNGQSASVLTTPVSCTTAYTTSSANGSTPSTSCSGAVAANYSFTYVAGTVTVGAGTQAPLILSSISGTFGTGLTLTSSGGSGNGAVTFAVTSAGSANCSINGTTLVAGSAGTCTVTATKAPDANYLQVSSTATTVTFAAASGLTTTITSAMNPSTSGLSVTFTIRVTTGTATAATGAVTIRDAGSTIGSCSLVAGTCTFATNTLGVGSHSITAVYGGDANYLTSTSSTLTQTVNATVSLASPSALTATYGTAYTATLTAAGGLSPYTYAASATLPAGFTLTSGVLSSTVSTTTGSYTFTITATDANGATGSTTQFTVTIGKASPQVTWTAPAAIFSGTALSPTQLNATAGIGGTLVYNPVSGTVLALGTHALSATFTPNDLTNYNPVTVSQTIVVLTAGTPDAPSGVSLTTSSSTPNALVLSWSPLTGSATGGSQLTDYQYRYSSDNGSTWSAWTTSGGPSVTAATLTSLTPNVSYIAQVRGITANSIGTAATSAAATAGISGPVINTQPASLSVTAGQSGFTLTVAATANSATTGAVLSYQWYLGGSAITGATSATYTNSGAVTSSVVGSYYVLVTSTASGLTATTQSVTVQVLLSNAPTILTTTLPTASPSGAYLAILAASGGVAPYTWRLNTGATLPSGLTLSTSGFISGVISATATSTTISVVVTDANGVSATATITIPMTDALSIAQRSLGNASIGAAYTQTLSAIGGLQPYIWSLASGSSLPAGLAFGTTGSGSSLTWQISGTPTTSAVTTRFTLVVTDANGATAQAPLSITISSAVPDAPTGLAIFGSVASGSVPLTWTPPVNVAGSPIATYIIDYFSTGDTGAVSIDATTLTFPYTLTGLTNGRSYTITVRAKNAIATSASSQPITVAPGNLPSAPLAVAAISTNGGLQLSWSKPLDDGGFALTYLVQCTPNSGAAISVPLTGLATGTTAFSFFVDSATLTAGSGASYTCQVRAHSAVGFGNWSTATTAVSVAYVPSAPTGVAVAESTANDGLDATWSKPTSDGGSQISGYVATSTRTSAGYTNVSNCSVTRPTDSTAAAWDAQSTYTCKITGVLAKGTFTVSVVAVNALGQSVSASASIIRLGATQTLASSPALPLVYTSGPTTPVVGDADFAIAASSTSGLTLAYATITSGVCTVSSRGMVHVVSSGTCTITISQNGLLDDGTQSDWLPMTSVSFSFVVKPAPPATPIITAITPANTTITVTWDAPSGTGNEVTGYNVEYSVDGSSWTNFATIASTAPRTSTITGLTNGTAYHVRINAVNTGNQSSWVTAIGTYTPYTNPAAPTIVSVTPTDANSLAAITWTAPPSNGGSPITGYTVTAVPTPSGKNKTCSTGSGALTCTIVSLANKTPYTFTVVANNAAGSSAASSQVSATLTGLSQTITVTALTPPSGGYIAGTSEVDLNAHASSGLPIQYSTNDASICTITGAAHLVFAHVGTCIVNIGQDGAGSNYSPAPAVSALTFTVLSPKPSMPSISSIVSDSAGLTVTWLRPGFIDGTVTYTVSAVPLTDALALPITCTATLPTLSCELTGLVKGVTYSITAVAAAGGQNSNTTQASVATWATVPSLPLSLVATAHNATTDHDIKAIDVLWSGSSDTGGAPINQYVATAYASGVDSGSCAVSATASLACTIRGLSSNTAYVIKVVAANAAGLSAPAPSSSITLGIAQLIALTGSQSATIDQTYAVGAFAQYLTVTAEARSSGVANGTPLSFASGNSSCTVGASTGIVQILHAGVCTITISTVSLTGTDYLPATSTPVTITTHAVVPSAAASLAAVDCPVSCSSARVVISGLTSGHIYSVVIHELNSASAAGGTSSSATSFTAGSTSMGVTWTDPDLKDFASDSTAQAVATDSAGPVISSATIATIPPSSSAPIAPTPPVLPVAPSAPHAVSNTATVAQSATVTWIGLGVSAPVTSYEVQALVLAVGGQTTTTNFRCLVPYSSSAESAGYSCVVYGLRYGTNYVFKVIGINVTGSGAASPISNALTLAPALSQTITFAALSDPQSIRVGTLSLQASSDSGLAITFSSSTPSVCTIDSVNGSLINFVAGGLCTIVASQNGLTGNGATSNYAAAASVSRSFTITSVLPDPTQIIKGDVHTRTVTGVVYQVDWAQAVKLGGSTFSYYEINWAPHVTGVAANDASAGSARVTDPTVLTYDIAGLLANVLYDVKVRVVTAFGVSALSDPILAMTYHSPGVPTVVSAAVSPNGPGAAIVTWTEPADNGGTLITGYTAEALVAGNQASTGHICTASSQGGGSVLSCTIGGLNGNTSYVFRVSAINGVGSSVSAVTSALSVGIAQSISIGNITQTHSRTVVTMPSLSNSTLPASATSGLPLSYSVSSSTPSHGAQGSRTVCSVDSQGVITIDLEGTCQIVASQNGNDAAGVASYYSAATSVTVTITVTATKPSEVQNVTASSGDRTLLLNWRAPANDGGAPITSYRVIWYPSNTPSSPTSFDVAGSATSYTIPGLANGVTYTVTVQALNAAGLLGL